MLGPQGSWAPKPALLLWGLPSPIWHPQPWPRPTKLRVPSVHSAWLPVCDQAPTTLLSSHLPQPLLCLLHPGPVSSHPITCLSHSMTVILSPLRKSASAPHGPWTNLEALAWPSLEPRGPRSARAQPSQDVPEPGSSCTPPTSASPHSPPPHPRGCLALRPGWDLSCSVSRTGPGSLGREQGERTQTHRPDKGSQLLTERARDTPRGGRRDFTQAPAVGRDPTRTPGFKGRAGVSRWLSQLSI